MYINIHRCRNCLSVIKSQSPAFLSLISSLSLVSATENPSNTSLHLMYRVLVAAMALPANTYSYFSYLWCFGEDRMLPTLIDKCVSQYHSVQCPPTHATNHYYLLYGPDPGLYFYCQQNVSARRCSVSECLSSMILK